MTQPDTRPTTPATEARKLYAIPGWLAEEEGGTYYHSDEVDALLAEAASPAALDPERLRRSFRWRPDLPDGTPDGRPDFEATAAEYARLTEQEARP